jgi:nucleotide-binding universal stress UspA family protein
METDGRILVPLDGSGCGETARSFPGVDPTMAQVKVVREAEEYLQGLEGRLRDKGFDVDTHVRYGDDAEEILDHAAQRDIELIAMSTQGHGGIRDFLFKSVAEKVLRDTPKPIFLVRCNN